MKIETKIQKAKAKFIKEMIELNECKNIKSVNAACRINPDEIRSILKKYDPITFIKINSFIDEELAFENITQETIDKLKFNKFNRSLKFKRFLELYVSGVRKTTEFEKKIPCTRRFVIFYRNCLKEAIRNAKQAEGENQDNRTGS